MSTENQFTDHPDIDVIQQNGKSIPIRRNRLIIGLSVQEKNFKERVSSILSLFPILRVVSEIPKLGIFVVSIPEGSDLKELIQWFDSIPYVSYVEPDFVGTLATGSGYDGPVPLNNNPYYQQQLFWLTHLDIPEAWNIAQGTDQVLLGIMDTGITLNKDHEIDNPDLKKERFTLGLNAYEPEDKDQKDDSTDSNSESYPEDNQGHGTKVAGVLAAIQDNDKGIVGINWLSPLYITKVYNEKLPPKYYTDTTVFCKVVLNTLDSDLADNRNVILNLSGKFSEASHTLRRACQYIEKQGAVLCAASGNHQKEMDQGVAYPAAYNQEFPHTVIAVGAITKSLKPKYHYSFAEAEAASPDVVGPGERVYTTTIPGKGDIGLNCDFVDDFPDSAPTNDFVKAFDGTSAATAFASGIVSLIWSRFPHYTPLEVKTALTSSADAYTLGRDAFDRQSGHGLLKAYQAITRTGVCHIPNANASKVELLIPNGPKLVIRVEHLEERQEQRTFHATVYYFESAASEVCYALDRNGIYLGLSEKKYPIVSALKINQVLSQWAEWSDPANPPLFFFDSTTINLFQGSGGPGGPWANEQPNILGFKWEVGKRVRYGYLVFRLEYQKPISMLKYSAYFIGGVNDSTVQV